MQRHDMTFDRRGAVSVLFAGAAVPIVGMLGLAIDYTFLNQARTQMALAADTAAISATRLASSEFVQPVESWQTDADTNGGQWFQAQLGSLRGATLTSKSVDVERAGTTFQATVKYAGTVPTHFAQLFGVRQFNIAGQTVASISINAYVNIALLLDNSSSMLIGATTLDIDTMQEITSCSPESMGSSQSGSGDWSGPATPPTCPSTIAKTTGVSYSVSPPQAGQPPIASPCGFACHWSNNKQVYASTGKPDYTQWDYYALSQNPTAYGAVSGYSPPTLRFAVVQSAAANVISTMLADEVLPNQFGLSVFTFGASLTKIYPATGEAGNDLSADSSGAQTAVTSIVQPVVTTTIQSQGDTNFPAALNGVATALSAGGDGSSAGSPKKALLIVTDGIEDYTNGSRIVGPVNTADAVAACQAVKAKSIAVYVLYTPYTPLPYNPYYVSHVATYINNPPTPNDTIQALQNCATSPSNYYEADIPSQITTGLNTLLKTAISSPAKINS